MFLAGSNVVLAGDRKFYIYTMPELRPYIHTSPFVDTGSEVTVEMDPVLRQIRRKGFAYQRGLVCHTDPHNHSFPGFSHRMDIIGDQEDDIPTLISFGIPANFFSTESGDRSANKRPQTISPVLTHTNEDNAIYQYLRWTSSWCNHNRLVHSLQPSGRISEVTAHLTTMDASPTVGRRGTLWQCGPRDEVVSYDICLVSGRMCIFTGDRIHIVDYLRRPLR
jgi:hypothetical protein